MFFTGLSSMLTCTHDIVSSWLSLFLCLWILFFCIIHNISQIPDYSNDKPEYMDYYRSYSGMDYLDGEDGELSWFNAGVRVGVGIGLSICVGVGIGVGLLVRTYQGTTHNFRRRLL